MLAKIEQMLTYAFHVATLFEQGKASIGMIGRMKSHNSLLAREVCLVARELVGGNGICLENKVIKQMMDIEALHTYEGTYEVNMLVSGREITGGIPAFVSRK